MATLRELAIRVTADSSSYQREMSRATRLGTDYYKTIEERSRRFDAYVASNNRSIQAMNAQLHSLKSSALSLATAFAGGFAITSIINTADDWGQMAARVKMAVNSVGGSVDNYQNVQKRLLEISNRNAKSITDSQELYIATASSMRDLGYSTNDTIDFIEAMSNSYTINATSAEKVQSSINAINKAMITGKVTSKQWQDLMASTPNIASALADSLKKDEAIIKNLGLSGQISMRQLAEAMIKVKDETGRMADNMGNTVKDGFTQISNSFGTLIGELNDSAGITRGLASGLNIIAENIGLVTGAAGVFVSIGLGRYFGRLSDSVINATKTTLNNRTAQISLAQTQLAAVKTLQAKAFAEANAARLEAQRAVGLKANLIAQNNLTAAINRQTQANNQLALAQSRVDALTSKMGLLSRASSGLLGLLGGPMGLAVTALTVGSAFFSMRDGAEAAKQPIEELQLPVDQLLARFKELNKGRQDNITAGLTVQVKTNSANVDTEIDKLRKNLEKKLRTEWITGNHSARLVVPKKDQAAINEYIGQLKNLKSELDKGTISEFDFGTKLSQLSDKLITAVGGGQEFKTALGDMTGALLTASDALGETQVKLGAIQGVAEAVAGGVKKLDLVDFPNLDNQLGTLSQQLDVSRVKSNHGAEAAYVLAGLQRAAGDAALEHAEDLITLATTQKLSSNMSDELAKKLTELAEKLRANHKLEENLKRSGKDKSPAELYKSQLDKLNNQINAYTDITELQKLRRQLAEGELRKLSEIQKKTLETKAIELDKLNAQKEYKSIMDSLRTPAEQQLDTYKQHLEFIEKGNFSLREREALLARMNKKSMESAPTFSYQNSYSGLGSDLLNVAEDDKKLHDWQEQQIAMQTELLDQKLINQQEYADAVVNIEETMQRKQQDIQSAYTLATLGTFSSLTGSIADMFKQTAGESSAAYKVMFLASRAAAIAQATISTLVAANKARELGYPMGEIAASTVMGLGMANVGMIAAQTITGMAHSGIDNIPREGTWLLDRGERVVDARTNTDLKNFLDTSKRSSSSGLTLNMPLTAGGGVTHDELAVFGETIKADVLRAYTNAIRPGGILNRR
ncbi:tape measure protein [Gilliamella apicola]|uniref:tape measure protein n=1 Tax=Gilliamella apicola TaxID=1196095 RepID=UPI003987FD3A